MVAPVYSEPQYNQPHPELDEEYLRLAEQGKTELGKDEVARLRGILSNRSRFWLREADYLKAGWSKQEIVEGQRRAGQMNLALDNIPRWDRRGLDYFFQLGTNDNVTPHVAKLYDKYPRFSGYVVPGGQHGTDGIGNQKRTVVLPEVKANSLAVFSNHFFGDRPRMHTPALVCQRQGGRIQVEVTFDEGPPARTGTLHWSADRPPEGSLPYEHSPWESAPMKQVDARTWKYEIVLPAGTKTIDVLSVHSDNVNNMPMHVSSPLRRLRDLDT
jgi:hypothetical protein